ncbi:MAG: phosphoribosylanthranilate isomerase [Planctomycetota bacterium]
MFRVKICGVTNPGDALAAVEAGADTIGLNFYPRSKRFVADDVATDIVKGLPADVLKIGVFVNSPADEMLQTARRVGLTAIQLHGDEPATMLAELEGFPVVRARRIGASGLAAIASDAAACKQAGRAADAVLVDAPAPGEYGGAGETFDWNSVVGHEAVLGGLPLILAGGLTPANVAAAIGTVRPAGVDVASGVESAPGKKDTALMAAFVKNARSAFDSYASD